MILVVKTSGHPLAWTSFANIIFGSLKHDFNLKKWIKYSMQCNCVLVPRRRFEIFQNNGHSQLTPFFFFYIFSKSEVKSQLFIAISSNITFYKWRVSDWLLFNAKWTIPPSYIKSRTYTKPARGGKLGCSAGNNKQLLPSMDVSIQNC